MLTGIAPPEQLTVLAGALEDYCRTQRIEPETPDYFDAGRLVMQLFNTGAMTPEEITLALRANPVSAVKCGDGSPWTRPERATKSRMTTSATLSSSGIRLSSPSGLCSLHDPL